MDMFLYKHKFPFMSTPNGTVLIQSENVILRVEGLRLAEFKKKVLKDFYRSRKNTSKAIRNIEETSSFTIDWYVTSTGRLVRAQTQIFKQEGVILTEPRGDGDLFLGESDKTRDFLQWLKGFGEGPKDPQPGKRSHKIEEWTTALQRDPASPLELPVSVASIHTTGRLRILLFARPTVQNTPKGTDTWDNPGVFLRQVTLGDVRQNEYARVDLSKPDWKQKALAAFLSRSLGDVKEQLSKKPTNAAPPGGEGSAEASAPLENPPTSAYVLTTSVAEVNKSKELGNEITEVELPGRIEVLEESDIEDRGLGDEKTKVELSEVPTGEGEAGNRGFWLHAGEISRYFNSIKTKRKPLVIFVYDGDTEEESEDEHRGIEYGLSFTSGPLRQEPPDPVPSPDEYEVSKQKLVEILNDSNGQIGKGLWKRSLEVTATKPSSLEEKAVGAGGPPSEDLDDVAFAATFDAAFVKNLKDAVLNFYDVLMRSSPSFLSLNKYGVRAMHDLIPYRHPSSFKEWSLDPSHYPRLLRQCLQTCHLFSQDPNDEVYRSARTLREVLWDVRQKFPPSTEPSRRLGSPPPFRSFLVPQKLGESDGADTELEVSAQHEGENTGVVHQFRAIFQEVAAVRELEAESGGEAPNQVHRPGQRAEHLLAPQVDQEHAAPGELRHHRLRPLQDVLVGGEAQDGQQGHVEAALAREKVAPHLSQLR